MAILGLVLLVLAVLFAVGVVVSSNGSDLEFFGQTVEVPNAGGLFLAGIITAAVAALGLALLLAGLARAKRKRAHRKALMREGHQAGDLQEENARLRAELASNRPAPRHPEGEAVGHGHGDAYDEQTRPIGRDDRPVYPGEGDGRDQAERVRDRQG